MKIAITGITGFVGGNLANRLIEQGHDVIGIGRQQQLPEHVHKDCNYLRADIRHTLPLLDADVVVHAAALASDTAAYADLYQTNVEGTKHVLRAACNSAVFIYISSSSVYSFANPVVKEVEGGKDWNALSGYGKTKFLAEELVRKENGIDTKYIFRPRAIYGVHDQVLLPRLLKLVKGNKLIMPHHLSKHISLTHINNLVDVIQETILADRVKITATYNIADGHTYQLYDVLPTLLSRVTQQHLKLVRIPAWLWETIVTANEKVGLYKTLNRFSSHSLTRDAVLNLEAAYTDLYFKPRFNFEDSYEQIATWVQASGGWKKYLDNHSIKNK